jgi:hypothetical protein
MACAAGGDAVIVRVSTGLSETCGYCNARIPKDALVCFLTMAMKKRCATCAGLTPEQCEHHYNDITISGERELDVAPKKTFKIDWRKSIARAFDTLPQSVREKHLASLMEREK